ncbi:Putative cutinase/acetylxylan esterase, jacalin-like lectin domain, alpha/Beta hydrolase [Colletotrichum destructivum]|uniref:cutinase n=1 Tax=Colletotrichum destructivum TaxID=34406 RepID=A0AAX4I7Y6_9PEZI|nr:Putative cutinase/acetylxylan esterase, jacalin-like lectin domain, alpha/Beta hydrolase [Colletotrichum destructivum]
MKFFIVVVLVLQCALALGLPAVIVPKSNHGERDRHTHSLQVRRNPVLVENEALDGKCKKIMFFYLRGSTQEPNMGKQPGPQLAEYLRQTLTAERIAVQGIEYAASLLDNACVNNQLCRPREVTTAERQIRQYMDKCPEAVVLAAGYSQGAAMLSSVISNRLEQKYKDRITAVVTFGNTMQVYNKNTIPNFPPDLVQMFCNKLDPVCRVGVPLGAALPGHLDYRKSAKPAAEFLIKKLAAAKRWPSVPVIADIDRSKFASMGLTFRNIFRGAPKGTSEAFNDAEKLGSLTEPRLVNVYGRGGARVDFLGVAVDGVADVLEHGGKGGDYKEMRLDEGEFWTKAEVCNGQKKGKDRIGYFRAESSKGKNMEVGKRTNQCQKYVAEKGGYFVGLYGEAGSEIDSLGLIEHVGS